MMRAQQTPVATPRHAIPPSTSRAPYGQIRPQVPPHASRYAAPPQLYPGRPPAHHQTPQPSAAMNSQRSTSFRPKLAPITKRSLPTRKPTEQKASGKDAKAPPGSASKRNTCNCKKSRCLKMYCECFSAKNYCEGCKCKDCHNTPMFESHRERAIKDALSKNSSAFQQQTGGCRCKRSACLKKYCEVRFYSDYCRFGVSIFIHFLFLPIRTVLPRWGAVQSQVQVHWLRESRWLPKID